MAPIYKDVLPGSRPAGTLSRHSLIEDGAAALVLPLAGAAVKLGAAVLPDGAVEGQEEILEVIIPLGGAGPPCGALRSRGELSSKVQARPNRVRVQSQPLVNGLELIRRDPAEEPGDPPLIHGAELVDERKGRFAQATRTRRKPW